MVFHSAAFCCLVAVVALIIPSSIAEDPPLNVAIQEMQKANYNAFVLLLKMIPSHSQGRLSANITFLMPKNRMLASAVIPGNDVLEFVLRHTIPAPMGFEYLKQLPTGSTIPSSEPELMMLKVSNGGRRSFFLNNVKLVSPNVCISGSSIRCHGIDGLLLPSNQTPPPLMMPTPSTTTNTMSPPPSAQTFDLTPQPPTYSNPTVHKSGSASSSTAFKGYLLHWVAILFILCSKS